MVQRLGPNSRIIAYPEGTWKSDAGITVGYILPLAERSPVSANSPLIGAPRYSGNFLPDGVIGGMINFDGGLPLELEFTTIGHLLKVWLGANGYNHVASTKQHDYYIPTTAGSLPGSMQLQHEFLEATAVYLRNRGVRINGFAFQTDVQGVAGYNMSVMGPGEEVQVDLAGSKTDDGYSAVNYFNGKLKYNGTYRSDLVAFSANPSFNLSRQDVAFNAGVAGSINAGKMNCRGRLELMFDNANDLSFYNDAVNETVKSIEVTWANGPVATCTQFLVMTFPAIRVIRNAPPVGGEEGLTIDQEWQMISDGTNDKMPGFYIGPTLGTFNVTAASNDKLGIKVDGGGTQTITLTAGATQTTDNVVSDINGTLTGAVADNFLGRVRITSSTTGSTSSIQIDTGVANTGHALFGFDGTARAGLDNCPMHITLFNARTTDY